MDFGATGLCDAKQLVSSDHHLPHLKVLSVFGQSMFHSDLKMARSWPHMSWWLSLILFISVSIQSLLLSLQDILTLFLYFFWVVFTDTSSVSEQERQSLEAVSKLQSAMFSLGDPESEDVPSPVLFELPAAASPSGLARALMGLGGLEDSCLHCPKLVPVSGINLGM